MKTHGLIVVAFNDIREAVRAVPSISHNVFKGTQLSAKCIARSDLLTVSSLHTLLYLIRAL